MFKNPTDDLIDVECVGAGNLNRTVLQCRRAPFENAIPCAGVVASPRCCAVCDPHMRRRAVSRRANCGNRTYVEM